MFHTLYFMGQYQITNKLKIWGVQVYILNVRFTRKKLNNISNLYYFMEYYTINGFIIYWK